MNFKKIKAEYYQEDFPKVRRAESDLTQKLNDWAVESRKQYLGKRIEEMIEQNQKVLDLPKKTPFWLGETIKNIKEQEIKGLNEFCRMYKVKQGLNYEGRKRKIRNYLNELRHIEGTGEGLEHLDIAKAKQYPISRLIDIPANKKINCLWHHDTNPSLHIYEKTNDCYCFSCGHYDDVIGLAIKLWNVGFVEAVKRLA